MKTLYPYEIHSPSIATGIVWPNVPTPMASQRLLQLYYFQHSERFAPERIRELQFTQLLPLINFASKTVPYYSSLPIFEDVHDLEKRWHEIPLLTRLDLQKAGDALFTRTPIPSHEPSELMKSTGSTGLPVTVKANVATQFFWNVLTLRDHLWHGCDPNATAAVIRFTENPQAKPPHGAVFDNWGQATYQVIPTGKCYHLTISTTEEEAAWLREVNPYYLHCNSSTLRELTLYFAKHGNIPSNLRSVHTNSEIVEEDLRQLVQQVLNIPIIDTYSAKELGYLALQCPEYNHYHIQSENVLVEVLNEDNQPCDVGEPGKVVVTALHNFSSPLIRYVIGDYAIPGDPCACGRTLPVLKKILGRQRNVIKMPDGKKIWPSFASNGIRLMDLFGGAQFQVIQKALNEIHINLAHINPFTPEQEASFKDKLAIVFGYPFNFVFNYLDKIERGPGGKYEDFKCEC